MLSQLGSELGLSFFCRSLVFAVTIRAIEDYNKAIKINPRMTPLILIED